MIHLPTISPPKGRLTEAEARIIGAAANRIVNLRGLRDSRGDQRGNGSITVPTAQGAVSLTLTTEDLSAVLDLLVERESNLLIQFDVELDA